MDLIRKLGAFAFASRLKRRSDRMKADVTMLYHQQGCDFTDNWFLVGYMLSRVESSSITEMAETLGTSRPTLSQIVCDMAEHGLLSVKTNERDRRCKRIMLTEKGRDTVKALEPVWELVGECTEELLRATGQDVLKALSDIERKLKKKSMFARVINKVPAEGHEWPSTC